MKKFLHSFARPIKVDMCVLKISSIKIFEPREKTGLRGFRPGSTQTGLYSHRRPLEA